LRRGKAGQMVRGTTGRTLEGRRLYSGGIGTTNPRIGHPAA